MNPETRNLISDNISVVKDVCGSLSRCVEIMKKQKQICQLANWFISLGLYSTVKAKSLGLCISDSLICLCLVKAVTSPCGIGMGPCANLHDLPMNEIKNLLFALIIPT